MRQQNEGHVSWRFVAIMLAALLPLGCGGTSSPGGATGAAGAGTGAAGTGAAGAGAAGTGTTTGQAGDTGGAAGGGTTGAAGAATGTGGAAGTTGSAGTTGAAGTGAGGSATGGTGALDAGTGGATDAGKPPTDASGSTKVLIYGVTTGFRHGSITAGANAITTALATHGLTTELVGTTDATNKADPTKLTAQALAGYGGVVLLAMSGEPFGYPATTEIQNLVDYVHNGGALVAVEDADHCYDGQFNGHPESLPYVNLIGNDFSGHPGGVAPATCTTMGTNASVMQLPATFGTTDEIYATTMFRADNQIVLVCKSSGDTMMRPVSYVREEGAGRMFYTALGHDDARWTAPMDAKAANSRLVENHVVPALLWAMRRQ